MPFNPDDYLAKKQVETAGSATNPSAGFNPDAYLSSKGVQTLPNQGNVQNGVSAAQAYEQSNPPTMLSAGVLGFEQGASYNAAKKAAAAIDAPSAAAFDVNQKEHPIAYGLGQIAGAIMSPNPIGKWAAIKDAGLAAKMAYNAAEFASRVGLSSFGASEKPDLAGKLSDVKNDLTSPLSLGLMALTTLAPAVPAVLKRSGNVVVKDGDKAVALGKGIKQALASEEGQVSVSRAVGQFENNTIQAARKGVAALGDTMDEVAAKNAETTVNAVSPLKRIFDWAKSVPDNELLDVDRVAKNKLMNYLNGQNETLAQSGGSENIPFQKLYEMKKDIGRLVFDPEQGASRTFAKSPEVRREAVNLYNGIKNLLVKSDNTKQFKEVSDAFTGVYKTMEAADNLGNSLASMADRLNVSGVNKRDAIITAFKSIPAQYIGAMPELAGLVTNDMDKVITAYNIAAKIAGKAPGKADLLSSFMSKLPLSEGNRLNTLNQLGAMSAGGKSVGPVGALIKTGSALTQPNALRSIQEPFKSTGSLTEIK